MSLRIALVQADFSVGALAGNTCRIAERIAEARDRYRADRVLLPELTVRDYPPEDLLRRPQLLADCAAALQRIAQEVTGIVAVVGWPEAAGAVVYNALSVLRDGVVAATYRKRDLPNYAVFDERRYFAVDPYGGPCVLEVNGVTVGLLICQDLWGLEPTFETAAADAQLILIPNASRFERCSVIALSERQARAGGPSHELGTRAVSCPIARQAREQCPRRMMRAIW